MPHTPDDSTVRVNALTAVAAAIASARPARRPQGNAGGALSAGVRPRAGLHTKRIEDIEVGDSVWAWDEASQATVRKPVVRLFRHQDKAIVTVTLSRDGATGQLDLQQIGATTEHPFWVEGKGWVAACQLQAGDLLKRIDGGACLRVVSAELSGAKADVFNFEVEGVHNYFVGGVGVLVHNQSGMEEPPPTVRSPNQRTDIGTDAEISFQFDGSEFRFGAMASPGRGTGQILDIGAGVGAKALTMAKISPAASVLAVEAAPTFSLLAKLLLAKHDPAGQASSRIEVSASNVESLVANGHSGRFDQVNIMAPNPWGGLVSDDLHNFGAMAQAGMDLVRPGGKLQLHTEFGELHAHMRGLMDAADWRTIELRGRDAVRAFVPGSNADAAFNGLGHTGDEHYDFGLVGIRPWSEPK